MRFLNRTDAGRQLAISLSGHPRDAIIMGVTRGGVPVAAEIARELGAPLEICVVRKLTAATGVTYGCVAEAGGVFLDWPRITALGLQAHDVEASVARETEHVTRLSALYRDRPALLVGGRDVILVDDGLCNPSAISAALHSLRRRDARSIELALPVADASTLEHLRPYFDRVLCLETEDPMVAIGARYGDFSAVSEAEVVDLLAGSRQGSSGLRRAVSRRAF